MPITKIKIYLRNNLSALWKYRFRSVLFIALIWLCLIVISYYKDILFVPFNTVDTPYSVNTKLGFWTFVLTQGVMCFTMAWLLVFRLKAAFRNYPLGVNLLIKSFILVGASFVLTLLMHTLYDLVVKQHHLLDSLHNFYKRALYTPWLFEELSRWLIFFLLTFLYIEINEKYSPGIFGSILMGRYIKPRIENRIVIFIDLKDSTTIAENLGHEKYFLFIRNFIYYVSSALLELNAQIYQYVGDEVVASWKVKKPTFWRQDLERLHKQPVKAILECRRKIQKHSLMFDRKFGVLPEFRVGIHCGEVSVGEIGVIKKDLAMSGDVMNTTARIRSACSELNEKFLISEDYFKMSGLKEWQVRDMGTVELKGKEEGLRLYALNM